jgi:hypothetical protein
MLDLIGRRFLGEMAGASGWKRKLRKIIPSFGKSLIDDADLYRNVHARATEELKLREDPDPRRSGLRIRRTFPRSRLPDARLSLNTTIYLL